MRYHSGLLTRKVLLFGFFLVGLVIGILLGAWGEQRHTVDSAQFIATVSATTGVMAPTAAMPSSPTPSWITVQIDTPEPTTTSTPSATPKPTTSLWVDQTLQSMTLEQKIGQLIMTGVDGPSCQLIREIQPGAVVYRKDNARDADSLRQLSLSLQSCAEQAGLTAPLIFAIDHEGEYVYRFTTRDQVTEYPMAMALAATHDSGAAFWAAAGGAQELRYAGVNMVLGPVADVLKNPRNTVLWLRTYGSDPGYVSTFVRQATLGYIQGGLIPVLKHFPGHGSTREDSHSVLPVDQSPEEEIYNQHLAPFRAGIEAGARVIMLSHVAYPALDPERLPASLSPAIIGTLLREQMGFEGVALTDALGMGSITESMALSVHEAGVRSIAAGADMLLIVYPSQAEDTYHALLSAVRAGRITQERIDEAARRILQLKAEHGLVDFAVPATGQPNWQDNREHAITYGQQAVTLVRNQASLVPIPPDKTRILIVAPTEVIESVRRYAGYLEAQSRAVTVLDYPKDGDILTSGVVEKAASHDILIVMTWDSLRKPTQAQAVKTLLDTGVPVIVVALRGPYDLLDFPNVSTYIATFGTTEGQLQGLFEGLAGLRYLSAPHTEVIPYMP